MYIGKCGRRSANRNFQEVYEMKKVITLITLLAVACALVIPAFASSYNAIGPTAAGTTHTVKKTDIGNVSKDGIIGANEYEKLDVNLVMGESPLHLMYGLSEDFISAESMLATMEYYASWSDGQINIAVKASPEDLYQKIHMSETDDPDDFCRNVALTISSDVKQERDKGKVCNFYYAVSLTTDTNEYQVAYYPPKDDSNQQGNSGTYVPTPGTDFVISYPGDGSVIFEWSIPFAEICAGNTAAAGDSVFLTIAATAGKSETGDKESSIYGIGLGDFGYLIDQKQAKNHAAFLLSDETIGGGETGGGETGGGSTGGGGTTGGGETGGGETGGGTTGGGTTGGGTTGGGTTGGGTTGGGTTGGGTAPRTGDPMMIVAAVSALGACGAVVIKRRFF